VRQKLRHGESPEEACCPLEVVFFEPQQERLGAVGEGEWKFEDEASFAHARFESFHAHRFAASQKVLATSD
jgi:hypothetical protein